ncbi:MAG: hypothetical protein JWM16_6056 [Verrucomicrobiales bacterium]|nr:hypothetical protein [Verrucomicrobiales bacterium]
MVCALSCLVKTDIDKITSQPQVRKYVERLEPGQTHYRIVHNLGTEDVIVQTRIAGRIRDGGISIVDANTVGLTFGGTLNELMDVVILG